MIKKEPREILQKTSTNSWYVSSVLYNKIYINIGFYSFNGDAHHCSIVSKIRTLKNTSF